MLSIGRLRYLETPASSERPRGTLVLLHAFPLNARMWEPQLAVDLPGWRIIAPQFRGFDASDNEPAAASVDDYAGDVIDLLDALHVDDIVLGGLSMGGYVSFALFRHVASRVRALVLADTKSQADTAEGVEGRKKMLGTLEANGPAAVAVEMVPKLLGETTRRERPELVKRIHALILANPPAAIAGAIHALMTRPDSTPVLSTIHCPTLILVGAEDTLTPPSNSEEMHRAVPGSELVTVPGSGHLSNLENPTAFNAALARFLTYRV